MNKSKLPNEPEAVRAAIREGYGKIAGSGGSCCGSAPSSRRPTVDTERLARQVGYSVEELTALPVNPTLYRIGTNSGYTACFDDITIGNNTNDSATRYLAAPGYDLCTGWGSPTGSSLINALAQSDGFLITPGRGAVANGPVGGLFTVSTQTLSLTNIGMLAFNWSLGGTPTWLDVSSSGGTLTAGGGVATVSLTLNSTASLLPAGVYTADLRFTNLSSGLAQLRQFTLQVGQELVQDGGFEAGDFCYWTLAGDSFVYSDNLVDNGTYTGYSPLAGNYFAAFGQVSDVAYLAQSLPTRPGQFYLMTFWLQNYSGATPNEFSIQWNNAAATNVIFNQVNMGAFAWSNMQFIVQASTNTTDLRFGFRNDNDVFTLDNVSVIAMPAPTIQSLALVGGSYQLSWMALVGARYQMQYSTDLAQANWINLGGSITATSNPMTAPVTIDPGAQRFYRVVLLPNTGDSAGFTN